MATVTMGENKTSLNEMIDSVLQASKAKHPRKDNAATIQYGTAGFRTREEETIFKLVLKFIYDITYTFNFM